jgi:cation:H+ antiporter
MIWLQFAVVAAIIVAAGSRLARYGDIIGDKSGLGGSWIGVVLLAATTSLPELFTGFSATALHRLPDIALGDVLGSCMFNMVILSAMDSIHPGPLSARAHQGHALAIGFGLLLVGVAGIGLVASRHLPALGWVGLYTPVLIGLYLVAMRVVFVHERRLARHSNSSDSHKDPGRMSLRAAGLRYAAAAVIVVVAAIRLPELGAELARQTGLGQAFVGTLFVAMTTSLPEIAVSLAAVRMGAVDLGVANVLGSNMFNFLILGLDDLFYREGPLLEHAAPSHLVIVVALVMMNGAFLAGLTYRAITKRFAVAWDTSAIAAIYAVAIALTYMLTS